MRVLRSNTFFASYHWKFNKLHYSVFTTLCVSTWLTCSNTPSHSPILSLCSSTWVEYSTRFDDEMEGFTRSMFTVDQGRAGLRMLSQVLAAVGIDLSTNKRLRLIKKKKKKRKCLIKRRVRDQSFLLKKQIDVSLLIEFFKLTQKGAGISKIQRTNLFPRLLSRGETKSNKHYAECRELIAWIQDFFFLFYDRRRKTKNAPKKIQSFFGGCPEDDNVRLDFNNTCGFSSP